MSCGPDAETVRSPIAGSPGSGARRRHWYMTPARAREKLNRKAA